MDAISKTTVIKAWRETLQESPNKFFYYKQRNHHCCKWLWGIGGKCNTFTCTTNSNGAQHQIQIDHAKRTHNLEGSITVTTIIKAADEQDQNKHYKNTEIPNAVKEKTWFPSWIPQNQLNHKWKTLDISMDSSWLFWFQGKAQQTRVDGDSTYNKYLPENHKK